MNYGMACKREPHGPWIGSTAIGEFKADTFGELVKQWQGCRNKKAREIWDEDYKGKRKIAESNYPDDGEGFMAADAQIRLRKGMYLTDDHLEAIIVANRKALRVPEEF